MKKRIMTLILTFTMAIFVFASCNNKLENTTTTDEIEVTEEKNDGSQKDKENKISKSYKNDAKLEDFQKANINDVKNDMENPEGNTILVDARPQESYSGWALEGAKNGGHLNNSLLFSSRWLDCEYSQSAPREACLERAINDQGITKDKEVIVYDYSGNQAAHVAKYFQDYGISNVKVFSAKELIDSGTNLESYTNHDMFLPTEIVKSISDVKTNKENKLTEKAKEIVGNDIDKVILVDVG